MPQQGEGVLFFFVLFLFWPYPKHKEEREKRAKETDSTLAGFY